jgi:hypothetical protein
MKPDAKLMAAIISAIDAYLLAEPRPLSTTPTPAPGPSNIDRKR